MVSGFESINSKAVNNCRNRTEDRQTKMLMKFHSVNSNGILLLLKYLQISHKRTLFRIVPIVSIVGAILIKLSVVKVIKNENYIK